MVKKILQRVHLDKSGSPTGWKSFDYTGKNVLGKDRFLDQAFRHEFHIFPATCGKYYLVAKESKDERKPASYDFERILGIANPRLREVEISPEDSVGQIYLEQRTKLEYLCKDAYNI